MRRFLVTTLIASGCILSGCATNSSVRSVQDLADEADRKAAEALSEAREAKRLAQEANERSMRSEEMLNRSFKRAMYK